MRKAIRRGHVICLDHTVESRRRSTTSDAHRQQGHGERASASWLPARQERLPMSPTTTSPIDIGIVPRSSTQVMRLLSRYPEPLGTFCHIMGSLATSHPDRSLRCFPIASATLTCDLVITAEGNALCSSAAAGGAARIASSTPYAVVHQREVICLPQRPARFQHTASELVEACKAPSRRPRLTTPIPSARLLR